MSRPDWPVVAPYIAPSMATFACGRSVSSEPRSSPRSAMAW
jgi:hypothetical protein